LPKLETQLSEQRKAKQKDIFENCIKIAKLKIENLKIVISFNYIIKKNNSIRKPHAVTCDGNKSNKNLRASSVDAFYPCDVLNRVQNMVFSLTKSKEIYIL